MARRDDIVVRPAVKADADAIARIHYAALELYHDFYAAFLAVHPRHTLPKTTAIALSNPKAVFLVATTRDGSEVLGFVRYHIETPAPTSIESPAASEKPQQDNPAPSPFAPKDHLKEVWQRLQNTEAPLSECYKVESKDREHAYVYHLMIDPSHQRQGIGKQLMEAVISAADRVSIPTFIVSSRESHGLYLQLGFKDLATRVIDNEAWAKEVCRIEQESGQSQFAALPTKYCGITEKEHLMVRWPIGT